MTSESYFVVDEAGVPIGMVDMDLLQAEGTALSYALAASANDRDELEAIATATLTRVGPDGFGYVAAVAVRQLAEGVVGPLLDVIDATRAATGVPVHDLRAGLADARDYAMAVAATLRAQASEGGDGQ